MAEELTKEACVQKYNECKLSKNGDVPEYREFLKHSGIGKLQLIRLFGSSAFSRLQTAAGDDPNKLQLERTPLATIMQQYANLVLDERLTGEFRLGTSRLETVGRRIAQEASQP